MAPVACAAAPRAPHVFQHGQGLCKVTPLILPGRPDVHQHVWITCTATHGAHMSISMLRLQILRHLVLLCVKLHGTASCTSTPSSSVDTQQVKWLTPRPDLLDQAT
ncbi:hypothetical protein F2Q70_00039166 [Brassica cretica]|uniref:Uncharacterized protein n=1 Tax=Brassica cretica TaxID=69181 RepID=A0A8S9KAB5_BRACR|nr:hypothetical protein F2Q70_00039166 [Brassica cretica]KAF2619460.1 hypothetical protein F2Q68_00039861 [Brassica cretica]